MLLALNKLWALGLSRDRLRILGLKLGADVPFFVYGRNAIGEGIGERLLRDRAAGRLVPRAHAASLGFHEGNL